ncbi:MAG TPA: hypothetical protein VND19_17860 [Acetobacteraceae bacterium]|nr:hypothetical protein [Acetobacteraceae bacterium]
MKSRLEPLKLAQLEEAACVVNAPDIRDFNRHAIIPYGVTVDHIAAGMKEFTDFLGFINTQLHTRQIPRLKTMLMPANFSFIVGEFMTSAIPKYCRTIVKNAYHNGHPDMIPAGKYPGDKLQHGAEGIEVKGSRYLKSWQGHNAEDAWLMMFCFSSGRPTDEAKGILPAPFRFVKVVGAQLQQSDWLFAGRSAMGRRTITASVTRTGYDKMMSNWIYKHPTPSDSAVVSALDD